MATKKPDFQHVKQEYYESIEGLNAVAAAAAGVDDALADEAYKQMEKISELYQVAIWDELNSRVEFYTKLIACLKKVVAKGRGAKTAKIVRFLQPIIDTAKPYVT